MAVGVGGAVGLAVGVGLGVSSGVVVGVGLAAGVSLGPGVGVVELDGTNAIPFSVVPVGAVYNVTLVAVTILMGES